MICNKALLQEKKVQQQRSESIYKEYAPKVLGIYIYNIAPSTNDGEMIYVWKPMMP